MADRRKRIGCCTFCDKEIFEVVSRYSEGPFKGEIREVGLPLPGARRVMIVRASGNTTPWSYCGTCEILPDDMPYLNTKEIGAMVKERSVAHDTMAQSEARAKMLRLFEWDIPIGVLGEMPWTEVR